MRQRLSRSSAGPVRWGASLCRSVWNSVTPMVGTRESQWDRPQRSASPTIPHDSGIARTQRVRPEGEPHGGGE